MEIVNGILDVEFILHRVFPGDYNSFHHTDNEGCDPCALTHVVGDPFEQWNCSAMREEKLDQARENKMYDSVKKQGVRRLIDIESFYDHAVLINGHHRFYTAWTLGFKRVPVSVCYSTRDYKLIPDEHFIVLGYWENRYSMA